MYILNELYDMICGMAEISDTLSLYIKQYNYEGIVAEYVVGFSYFCDLVSSILQTRAYCNCLSTKNTVYRMTANRT